MDVERTSLEALERVLGAERERRRRELSLDICPFCRLRERERLVGWLAGWLVGPERSAEIDENE